MCCSCLYLRIYTVQAYKMTSLQEALLFFLSFTGDYVPAAIYAMMDTKKTILKKEKKLSKIQKVPLVMYQRAILFAKCG